MWFELRTLGCNSEYLSVLWALVEKLLVWDNMNLRIRLPTLTTSAKLYFCSVQFFLNEYWKNCTWLVLHTQWPKPGTMNLNHTIYGHKMHAQSKSKPCYLFAIHSMAFVQQDEFVLCGNPSHSKKKSCITPLLVRNQDFFYWEKSVNFSFTNEKNVLHQVSNKENQNSSPV